MADNEVKWYQKSLRRLLVDMHIPDWDEYFLKDFSAERYADMLALAKVDTAELYAGSCLGLCYWPTKIGIQHRQLHGRDLLGENVEACRKRGMKIQIYLNVWCRAVYEAHPEWRIVLADGKTSGEDSRFGHCCINTPYRQYFLDLFGELVSRYECEGYWIDMIGIYWPCYCAGCREKFLKKTGNIELPRKENWTDPLWRAYADFQSESLNDFAAEITAVARKHDPKRTVTFQTASIRRPSSGGIREKFLQAGDYLAGDFTGDRIEQSFISKYFSALSSHHPMEFMTPRCETLNFHTSERPFENMLMRAYAAITNQTSFTLIDAIDPAGTLNRGFYERARKLNEAYAEYEGYIDGASRPLYDIGLFYSPDSTVDIDKEKPDYFPSWGKDTRASIQMLSQDHQLFYFVRGSDPEQWKNVPVIYVSDCMFLSEAECAALEKYVEDGGCLIATKRTSLYDPADGSRRADFRLAKLLGVHFRKMTDLDITYIAPAKENSLADVTADYPLQLDGTQAEITADPDTEVIATLTLAKTTFEEKRKFYSALSNPPMVRTDSPAIVVHRYGKGKTMYIAGSIEKNMMACHFRVMNRLIRSFQPAKMLETNAPPCLECTVFDQADKQRLLLSCLNLPAELPVIPLHEVEFKLCMPSGMKVKKVTLAPEEKDYPFAFEDGVLKLQVPVLNRFMMFNIGYSKS